MLDPTGTAVKGIPWVRGFKPRAADVLDSEARRYIG